jgi:hypothetical protein
MNAMPQISDKIKAVSSLQINYAARIVGYAIEHFGLSNPKDIADAFNIPLRTVYQAKSDYFAARAECADFAESAAGCAQPVQPAAILQPAAQLSHIEERTRLKETPSELSSPKEVEETVMSEVPSDQREKASPKSRKRQRRFSYTAEFEAFWGAYPDRTNNSKRDAFTEWLHLLPAEQQLATDGLRHLAAHCRKNPDYRCLHAVNYLKQGRWESYEPKVVQFPTQPKLTALELDQIRDAKMLALCASMPTKSAVQQ